MLSEDVYIAMCDIPDSGWCSTLRKPFRFPKIACESVARGSGGDYYSPTILGTFEDVCYQGVWLWLHLEHPGDIQSEVTGPGLVLSHQQWRGAVMCGIKSRCQLKTLQLPCISSMSPWEAKPPGDAQMRSSVGINFIFFNAVMQNHEPGWHPCEAEALPPFWG